MTHRRTASLAFVASAVLLACSSGGGGATGGDAGAPAPEEDAATAQGDAGATTPETCAWPTGPYGRTVGSTLSPYLHWQGYRPGSTEITDVSIKDFYDCDGTKGITAILFDESALWCGPCQEMASQLEDVITSSWEAAGVQVVSLIAENSQQKAATTTDAKTWKDMFGLDHVTVVADPKYSLVASSGQIGLPYSVLVDPRTMRVVQKFEGYAGRPEPAVLDLAQQNAP